MDTTLEGLHVKLTVENPEIVAKALAQWNLDSEYLRFLDSEPPRMYSEKKYKEWFEKNLNEENADEFFFSIKLNQEMIGFMGIFDLSWNHGDALVSIAIGDRKHWGKGYGTDAMRIMLRYIFNELNLRRVSLIVFGYNARAQRSYEKSGFVVEGRMTGMMQREGQRWDWLWMGITKDEWRRVGV